MRGVARCLPGAGQTLPANNRVTSRKPLTAAGELVSGEGGRRSRSVAATAALEGGYAAEWTPAPGCRAFVLCRRAALGTDSQSQCVPLGSGPDLCRRRACARLRRVCLQVSVDQLMAGSPLNREYVSLSALTGSFLHYYELLCAPVHMSVCSVVMLLLRCGDICSRSGDYTDGWLL